MEEEERLEVASMEGGSGGAGATEDDERLSPFVVATDQPDWLPSGWVMETRTQKGGAYKGREIKCYTNLSTGFRLYSRKQLFRHLNGRSFTPTTRQTRSATSSLAKKNCTSTAQEKCTSNSSFNNGPYEYHSKSLPNGWTKEIRFRMSEQGTTKFSFYIDPDRRYAFYSMKDAHRYIATGDIRKCVLRPQNIITSEMHTIERELHVPASAKRLDWVRDATKRCLFSDKRFDSDVDISSEVNEALQISSLSQAPADPSCITSHNHLDTKNSAENKLPDRAAQTLDLGEERVPRSTRQNSSDSVSSEVSDKMGQANKRPAEVPLQNQRENLPTPEVKLGEMIQEPQPVKHRGRKPGSTRVKVVKVPLDPEVNLLDETMLEQEEEQSQPTKPKRGRKPKAVQALPVAEINLLDGTIFEQTNEEQLPTKNKRGRKPKIKTLRRTSERLAALRRKGTTNSGVIEMPLWTKSNESHELQEKSDPPLNERCQSDFPSLLKEMPQLDLVQFNEFEKYKHTGEESNAEEQDQLVRVSGDKLLSPCTSPFGDSWTDPCLEFAFKMLTSDIPILEDTGNVKECIQQLDSTTDSIPVEPASLRTLTSSSQDEYHKF